MARPKSTVSTTSTEEKKSVEVAETTEVKKAEETVEKTEKKSEKKIADSDSVTIFNPKYALKKVRALIEVYEFDKEGKAVVKGKDAKAFLSLPGFSIA